MKKHSSLTLGIITSFAIISIAGCSQPGNETQNTQTNQATSTPQQSTTYSMNDIAQHNAASDCWTVVNKKVYNITSFIPNHPGGEAIVQACGKDGTQLFNSEREHREENAQSTLNSFVIGNVQ